MKTTEFYPDQGKTDQITQSELHPLFNEYPIQRIAFLEERIALLEIKLDTLASSVDLWQDEVMSIKNEMHDE